jgi:hypothetical protein
MNTRIKPDEQFARLLEVSSSVAAVDPTMGSLASLANALRVAGQAPGMPRTDPAFRAALRQRLVAVATVQAPAQATTTAQPGRNAAQVMAYRAQRRIAALAGVVTLSTSLAGIGVAAARSLPGDPFYGVKRATESVQLWATRGDEAKGKRHLEFARTRLAEAKEMSPTDSHLASTLSAMDAETKEASTELISAYHSSHSTQPLADLVTFSSQQLSDLNQLATTLPDALKAKEAASAGLVTSVVHHVHKVARGVCILCGPTGNGGHTGPPSPQPSNHPSRHPSDHPSTGGNGHHSTHPTSHPTKSGSPTKSSGPKSTHTPIIVLPTITPSSIISSILHPKKHKPNPVISTVIGLLGGKGKH